MSELELIRAVVGRTARRRRLQAAWQGLWRGLLAGSILWLLVLITFKLLPLPFRTLAWAGAAALLLILAAGLWGMGRRRELLRTAQWVDDQHRFQERLSTALELAGEQGTGRWRDLIVQDAAERVREFDVRKAMPFKVPRLARLCVVVLVLAAGLGFVPEYRSAEYRRRAKDAVVVQETGRQLVELVKRELQTRPPALETTRTAMESVQELGQRLSKVQLTRNEALKELASATERLERQLKELGRDPVVRRLEEGSRTGPDGAARTPEGLQKQMDALQEALGKQANQAAALDQLKQKLQDLQQSAASLAQAEGGAAEALKQEMSQALAELGKQADEMGLDLAGLDEAIQALSEGKVDQMLRELDSAYLDLDKMAQMAKSMKELQKQMAELGKTLAEQLEKGQGLAAYATLRRMVQQLEKADISGEQLEQMLAEVSKAVPVGAEYGPLGDFLKQGADALRGGQKPEAAAALAKAADELKRLMQGVSDCEGMMAALEGMKTGQMCIGNGMGWGICRSQGVGSKPGKPGRGVGTWGDDSLWMDAPDTGLWDNSGIERPDMDSRGLTDRGEGELNPGLTPTKVRGQISPGGPMPSITLRGVSIKGQSRVEFEERVAAAQSDAQSALSQDQVPRAYRGAVRDYFDDLK